MTQPLDRVLIIVPVYNEAKSLSNVLGRLEGQSNEVLIVDDASTDSSVLIAKSRGFRVLELPFNLGIGGAVQAGFQHAVAHGYDAAVQFDGDGQHRLEFLPSLLKPIADGQADVVIGSRFLGTEGYSSTVLRLIGIRFFSTVCSKLSGARITDCTSGFRALSRDALQFCAKHYPVDFPDMEALLLMAFRGFRIQEVPVSMNARTAGHSSTNWVKAAAYPFLNAIAIYSALSKKSRLRVSEDPAQ